MPQCNTKFLFFNFLFIISLSVPSHQWAAQWHLRWDNTWPNVSVAAPTCVSSLKWKRTMRHSSKKIYELQLSATRKKKRTEKHVKDNNQTISVHILIWDIQISYIDCSFIIIFLFCSFYSFWYSVHSGNNIVLQSVQSLRRKAFS